MKGICRRALLMVATALVLGACDGSRGNHPSRASGTGRQTRVEGRSAPGEGVLPSDLGVALVFPADSAGQAILVGDSATDLLSVRGRVTLVGRDGRREPMTIDSVMGTAACRLAGFHGTTQSPAFAFGVLADSVIAMRSDSLTSLGRRDSVDFARQMTGFASVAPGDTANRFTGLPFLLLSLWRTVVRAGPTVVVATFRRQIPMEASPLEERTLVIAERDSASGELTAVYSARTDGPEETVEATEFLGMMMAKPGAPLMMVLSRDAGDGTAYSLLQRAVSPKRWTMVWMSAAQGC